MWRISWRLESRRSSITSSSSSPVHLLRPAQTTFLKPIKEAPSVNIRQFWTAIQEHVLSLQTPGTDPVNAMAR
ncbi:hypothetical protein Taro_045818 [Colocasia esculenta]|uniref:Uncharacterized protein n=1 Tax=Colocasia esculenta TaxID=4460 RepID=A0A843X0Z5_COLES|nr:hypothetical protein [Colocasia esculenta]